MQDGPCFATYQFRNGIYQGFINKNLPDGLGLLLDDYSTLYFSYWKNGRCNGQTAIFFDKTKYIYGQWSQGNPHGFNIFRSKSIVLLGNYTSGNMTGKQLVVFQKKKHCIIVNNEDGDKFILQKRQYSTDQQLKAIIKNWFPQIRQQLLQIKSFLTKSFYQSNGLVKSQSNNQGFKFGYKNGLSIIFNEFNQVYKMGMINQKRMMIGLGIVYSDKMNQQGNFQTKNTIKYQIKVRPTNRLKNLFRNQHIQSIYCFYQYTGLNSQMLNEKLQEILLKIRNQISDHYDQKLSEQSIQNQLPLSYRQQNFSKTTKFDYKNSRNQKIKIQNYLQQKTNFNLTQKKYKFQNYTPERLNLKSVMTFEEYFRNSPCSQMKKLNHQRSNRSYYRNQNHHRISQTKSRFDKYSSPLPFDYQPNSPRFKQNVSPQPQQIVKGGKRYTYYYQQQPEDKTHNNKMKSLHKTKQISNKQILQKNKLQRQYKNQVQNYNQLKQKQQTILQKAQIKQDQIVQNQVNEQSQKRTASQSIYKKLYQLQSLRGSQLQKNNQHNLKYRRTNSIKIPYKQQPGYVPFTLITQPAFQLSNQLNRQYSKSQLIQSKQSKQSSQKSKQKQQLSQKQKQKQKQQQSQKRLESQEQDQNIEQKYEIKIIKQDSDNQNNNKIEQDNNHQQQSQKQQFSKVQSSKQSYKQKYYQNKQKYTTKQVAKQSNSIKYSKISKISQKQQQNLFKSPKNKNKYSKKVIEIEHQRISPKGDKTTSYQKIIKKFRYYIEQD